MPSPAGTGQEESAPIDRLELARGDTVRSNRVATWSPTWDEFLAMLRTRPVGDKDGTYFTRCNFRNGERSKETAHDSFLAIIDADQSLDLETGETWEGAPPPETAHEILTGLDLPHVIYTSHSHGAKGNRWRAVFPVRMAQSDDLPACVGWILECLHAEGCNVAPVDENCVVPQPWYFPRVPDAEAAARFVLLDHDGGIPFPLDEARQWHWRQRQAQREPTRPITIQPPSEALARKVRAALAFIPAENYGTWTSVGMALQRTGFDVSDWIRWSETCPEKFESAEACRKKWATFDPNRERAVGLPTIFRIAESYGFTPAIEWRDRQTPATDEQKAERRQHAGFFFGSDLQWDTRPAEPIDFIIPGWLPAGLTACLAAPPKTGKTRLADRLALSVVIGEDFFGLPVPRARRVLVLAGEDTKEGAHRRQEAELRTYTTEQRERWRQGYVIRPGFGLDSLLTIRGDDRKIKPSDLFHEVEELVSDYGIELVIVDTLARAHSENEVDRAAMTQVVATLEQLATRTGATVLAIAHTTKSAAKDGTLDRIEAVSGSTGVVGAFRAILTLSPMTGDQAQQYALDEEERQRYLRLRVAGANDFREPEPIWIDRSSDRLERADLIPVHVERDAARTAVVEGRYLAALPKIKKLIQGAAVRAQRFTRREFEQHFGGQDGEIGLGQKALRGVLQTAIARGDLAEQRDLKEHTNHVGFLAVPARKSEPWK